jgi:hypothetical protein
MAGAGPDHPVMKMKKYVVVRDHASEYPEPITFTQGDPLVVGEKYAGPEDWDNWYFCHTPGQKGGWVPAQIIEVVNGNMARARADYTARELSVQRGSIVFCSETMNGWAWCMDGDSTASGWVPLASLQETDSETP